MHCKLCNGTGTIEGLGFSGAESLPCPCQGRKPTEPYGRARTVLAIIALLVLYGAVIHIVACFIL